MPSNPRLFGLLCLVLAVAIAGAFVVYAREYWPSKVAVNAEHCPLSPRGTRIGAIDQTDVRPPQEVERIENGILNHAEAMGKHERLALYIITGRAEDSAAPWPVPDFPAGFRLCKPVDLNIDPSVQNYHLARASYEEKFLKPLRTALPHLVTGAPSERSPLLHAIEIMLWSPYFSADIPKRTLVIYSDFLLHTKELSQLTQPLTHPCTVLGSDIGRRLAARDWTGVVVVLEYLRNPRDAARQTPEHLRFWTRLFYLLGAAQVFNGGTLVTNEQISCAPTPAPDTPRITRPSVTRSASNKPVR